MTDAEARVLIHQKYTEFLALRKREAEGILTPQQHADANHLIRYGILIDPQFMPQSNLRARSSADAPFLERQRKMRNAKELIDRLVAFKIAEPRIARHRFLTRRAWKDHHHTFRSAWKAEIRRIAQEAME